MPMWRENVTSVVFPIAVFRPAALRPDREASRVRFPASAVSTDYCDRRPARERRPSAPITPETMT